MIWLVLPTYLIISAIILYIYEYQVVSYYTVFILFIIFRLKKANQPSYFYGFAPKNDSKSNTQNNKKCQICKQLKPPRYYHCRRCKMCIYRMNHHCNWVQKCIGLYNLKVYLSLLFHLKLLISLSIVIISFLTIRPYVKEYISIINQTDIGGIYWSGLLLIDLFILSQSHRLWKDCWQGLKCNQTMVQSYKKVHGKKQSIQKSILQITNGKHWLSCLIPVFITIKRKQNFFNIFQQVFQQSATKKEDKVYDDDYFDQDEEINELFPKQQ